MPANQTELKNHTIQTYSFLKEMYMDGYFPNFLVDKGKQILVDLCFEIEKTQPKTQEELYDLTHAATEKFNDLQEEFFEHDSEIETVARDCISLNFLFIANAYGFKADIGEIVATRDW